MVRISADNNLAQIDSPPTQDSEFWLQESVSMLGLSTAKGVGYWTLRKLAQAEVPFQKVIKSACPQDFNKYLTDAGCKSLNLAQRNCEAFLKELWSKGLELYRKLSADEIKLIHYKDKFFPDCLRNIPEPPMWIFVQGDLSALCRSAVAIVGTRRPSSDGRFLAQYTTTLVSEFNPVTVSGLASGIDQIVHRESIRYQMPTIAVLGNGIYLNYPAGSETLRYDICVNGGAIVTEYLPYQNYSAETFVRRNRLQAALADIVIPVEWKSRSGTAHTVRYASISKKPIVSLRMPDWSDRDHGELSLAQELGGRAFTVPKDQEKLVAFICQNIKSNTFQTNEETPLQSDQDNKGFTSQLELLF